MQKHEMNPPPDINPPHPPNIKFSQRIMYHNGGLSNFRGEVKLRARELRNIRNKQAKLLGVEGGAI